MTASTGAPIPTGPAPAPGLDWGQWIRDHTREVGFVLGAVAVVAVGAWLYVTSENRKELFASQALAKGRGDAEAGDLPLAAYDLNQLMDRYSGTRAADEGQVLLAQVRLVQGGPQTAAAVQALQAFVKKRHADYILASAWSLLGGGLEQQSKYREAAEAYRQASQVAPRDFLKAQYLLDAGRTLAVAGDSAGARKAYGEVLERFAALNQSAEARVRLGELGGTAPAPKAKGAAEAQKSS
jgi:predicted negative regulator of RcsB-dependent stress response